MSNNHYQVQEKQDQTLALSEASLNMLSLEQIQLIEKALTELGPFGEIRLIKAKGKLRFIQKLESISAL